MTQIAPPTLPSPHHAIYGHRIMYTQSEFVNDEGRDYLLGEYYMIYVITKLCLLFGTIQYHKMHICLLNALTSTLRYSNQNAHKFATCGKIVWIMLVGLFLYVN